MATKTLRILMLDDYPEQITQMADVFQRFTAGCVFDGASHAKEALQKWHKKPYDLIIMDQQWTNEKIPDDQLVDLEGNLPGKGRPERLEQGIGITRYLRKNKVKAPIIFATSAANIITARKAVTAGATTYYSKKTLLAQPDFALHFIKDNQGDYAFLQRNLSQLNLQADSLIKQDLISKRAVWNRKWPLIVQELLETLAAKGEMYLSITETLTNNELPSILERNLEPFTVHDLVDLLCIHGIVLKSEDIADHKQLENFILLNCNDGRLLAVLAPNMLDKVSSIPSSWDQQVITWRERYPGVLPATIKELALGPKAPYWDSERLVYAEVSEPSVAWSFESSGLSQRLPLAASAGRIGFPGANFWQQMQEQAAKIEALPNFTDQAASLFALYALNDKTTTLEIIPFPKHLLSKDSKQNIQPASHHLIHFHQGIPAQDKDIERQLAQLPNVEIFRSGYATDFEEQTLQTTLKAMAKVPGVNRTVWLATDFLHVRSGRLLHRFAQELDLVILAPQGICILECKASNLESDFRKAHGQVNDARKRLWGSADNKHGGIFLKPLLLNRLHELERQRRSLTTIPNDVLNAIPHSLKKRLYNKTTQQAQLIISDYYQPLEELMQQGAIDLKYVVRQDFLRPHNRKDISALLGLIVAPGSCLLDADQSAKGLSIYVFSRDHELSRVLQDWLKLPPIFNPMQLQLIRETLGYMSHGAESTALQELPDFTPERGIGELNGWRHVIGKLSWDPDGQLCTLLIRKSTNLSLQQRRIYQRWLVTALKNIPLELRWLDSRGLPPVYPRDFKKCALLLRGKLELASELTILPTLERLQAISSLLQLGWERPTAEVLGSGNLCPQPLAMRVFGQQHRRYGWLPGPPRKEEVEASAAYRQGLRWILEILTPWFNKADPIEIKVIALFQKTQAQLKDARQPMPKITALKNGLQIAMDYHNLEKKK